MFANLTIPHQNVVEEQVKHIAGKLLERSEEEQSQKVPLNLHFTPFQRCFRGKYKVG